MLLDQPGGQVASQLTGPTLALVEGNQVGLVLGVEHLIEGGRGMSQPLLA
jgi:hypothetical protein